MASLPWRLLRLAKLAARPPLTATGRERPAQRPVSLVHGGALEAKDFNLGGHDFRRPGEHGKAARHGDFLRAVGGIGDHAAADRATEILPPKFLAGCGVERIEIAADVAEEDDASGRRSHAAEDWVVGLQP